MAQCARMCFSFSSLPAVFSSRFYSFSPVSRLERDMVHACRRGELNEAMGYLRMMLSNNPMPTHSSLSAVFHACQMNSFGDSVLDELVSYSKRIESPDVPLASAHISCLSSHGRVDDAWDTFQFYCDKGITLRETSLALLLGSIVDHSKDVDKVRAVLRQINDRGCPIPTDVGIRILTQAIVNTDDSWNGIGWDLLQVYRNRIQALEEDLVPGLIEWFEKNGGTCQSSYIVPSSNEVASAFKCSACDSTLEYGISSKEQTLLFDYTCSVLDMETQFFEDNEVEEFEIQYFMNSVKRSGPYGAVIDGMNVTYCLRQKNINRIIRVSRDMLDLTKKPVMVVMRKHIMDKIRPIGYSGSKLTNKEVARQYRNQGIDLFYISNRVADDKYFIHAALSYPNTLLVTNDLLRDYLDHIPPSLKKTFVKWQAAHQTRIGLRDGKRFYKIPSNQVVQWTPRMVHVPIDNGKWICVTRNR